MYLVVRITNPNQQTWQRLCGCYFSETWGRIVITISSGSSSSSTLTTLAPQLYFMAQQNLPGFNSEQRWWQSPDLDIEDSDYIDTP